MKSISQYLLNLSLIICLQITLSPTVQAGTVETLDENHELFGLIPDFFLDTSGFIIEGENRLSLLGADYGYEPVPLFPLYDKGIFQKSFIGLKVPAEFFSGRPEETESNRRGFVFTTLPMSAKQMAIAKEISKIKFEDGIRLVPYFYNGALYAIRSDIGIEMGNQTTIGLSLSFSRGRTVKMGSNLVIGGSLSLGGTTSYIDKPEGLNILSGFQKFFDLPSEIQNFEDQQSFYRRTIKFAPYIRHYLNRNAEGLRVPHSEYRATRLGSQSSAVEPKIIQLNQKISEENLSSEWRNIMRDLREPKNLNKEIKWREEVKGAVENQMVLASDSANQFLQDLCDHMAAAYEVPKELYPRCRIAATLAPNAWAYPGGDIFVSVGLIGILSDLDSLRLVIGHEIAHVLARHTSRAMPGRKAFMYAAAGASLAAQATLGPYALSGGRGLLGEVTWLTWFPQSMALSMAGAVVTNIGMEVLFLGPYAALMAHQRSFEWQADRLGHEAALATGAQPEKLGQGWLEFRDFINKYLDPDGSRSGSLLASHPNAQARFESIQSRGSKLLQQLKPYQVNRLPETYYRDYSELHEQFKPNTLAWGENALNKLKAGDSRAAQFSLNSLFSPAGQCIIHALSGNGLMTE
jgi:Zn-dependent protease with chaperone function